MSEPVTIVPCPFCASENTRRNAYSRRAFGWMMLLFGIPFPAKGRTWFCFDCRKEFRPIKVDNLGGIRQ